jgi:Glyoxalase-like domain
MSAVTFELDHVFVMSSVGAPEGERLLRAGVPEGPPNTHPGQGTACRRFLLGNAYIELVWVRDEEEARSEAVRMTQL